MESPVTSATAIDPKKSEVAEASDNAPSLERLRISEPEEKEYTGTADAESLMNQDLIPIAASPNPWSDVAQQSQNALSKKETELAAADVEKDVLAVDRISAEEKNVHHSLHTPDPSTMDMSITAGLAADPDTLPPPTLHSPPPTHILDEFDPLADREEEDARKAWERSEGHPPAPPSSDRTTSPPPPVPPSKDAIHTPTHRSTHSLGSSFPSSLAALARSFSIPALSAVGTPRSRPVSLDTAKAVPSPNTLSYFATQQDQTQDGESSSSTPNRSRVGTPSNVNESNSRGSNEQSRMTSPTQGNGGEPSFDFQKFLDQMKLRSAEPVSKYLKSFLTNFAKRTFTVNDQIKIINDFLNFISNQMRLCEPWKSASDAEFDNAMEGMEKLVMNQLYQYTFTPAVVKDINPLTGAPRRPVTADDLERDRVLAQRIALFGWIREEHLDVPVGEGSNGFLMFAEQELLKINHYKAPRDKLICILNCCKVIFGLIRHLRTDEGADSFVPILIFVVLKANPDNLLSNVEFINRFRNPEKLQSEAGYYLSSLMGAVQFIETMDHTSLSNITQEEFEKNVETAIQNLPLSADGSPAIPYPGPINSVSSTSSSSSSSSSSSISSISTPRKTASPHAGEESAQPLSLPLTQGSGASTPIALQLSEDARMLLRKTGDAVSKPLNAISRIFNEALDMVEDPFSSNGERNAGSSRFGTPGTTGAPTIPSWSHPNTTQVIASQSLPDSRSSSPAPWIGGFQTPAPSADSQPPPIQTPYKPRVKRVPSPGGYLAQAQALGQGMTSPGYSPEDTPSRPRVGQAPYTNSPLAIGPSQALQAPPRGQSFFRPGSWNGQAVDPQYVYQYQPGSPSYASRPATPGTAGTEADLDIAGMQAEIDSAHSRATEAARETLIQIFPAVDTEVIEWVLEANENDLGKSIEQLLEMAGGE